MAKEVSAEIDAFISKRPQLQQQQLQTLRKWSHELGVPVEEKVRWGAPHIDFDGIMYGFMAFKNHINVFFHKGALMNDSRQVFEDGNSDKGSRSLKIFLNDELNETLIKDLFKEAIRINKMGLKITKAKPKRKAIRTPPALNALLKKAPDAMQHWQAFAPSRKREFVEWINNAKQSATKKRRITASIELITQNKGLHDKYKPRGN